MPRPLVSVVLSTYNRAHLLARSLICYEKQEFDNDRFELVVVDDHSTDDTRDLVLDWSRSTGIRAVVVTDSPKPTAWRDCGAVLNCGIRASTGEHVLLTHPEVMVGRKSVAACVDQLQFWEENRRSKFATGGDPVHPLGLYTCCKVYYLSPREQELIDTCPWIGKGAIAVREIEGFYELDVNGHPDFCHKATDRVATPGYRIPVWESLVWGGFSRETWKRLGGLKPSQKWGAIDVGLLERRRTLGIPNYTCPDENTIVVHQNHDDPTKNVPTDRDMAKWVEELKTHDLRNPQNLVYPAVDELGWGG